LSKAPTPVPSPPIITWNWYRELFAPSVTAGILKPGDLW
jgi:hypothetical protein